MEHDEPERRRFFRYKVLEDAEILQRAREHGSLHKCLDCCSCASLPRCLSFCRFFLQFSTSLFLAMAPWAMALTEALVTALLYLFVVHPDGVIHYHYSWWTTEQDVVLLSWTRSLVALVSFFLGRGRNMHVPYMVVAVAFAGVGLPFVAVKAIMLRRALLSKWGVLLLASAFFSVAHIIVAMTAHSLARRRYQMGLLGQDEEQPWLLGDSRGWKRHATDESEVPAAHLADELSNFVDCKGLVVHYNVEQPEVERDPHAGIVLIHGFGAGTFAWRHIISKLAHQTQCRVYAFDRPGFGLTSRPLAAPHTQRPDPGNPYRLQFQADLVLKLCQLWSCERVVLIGHSDGALVALRAAAEASRASRLGPAKQSPEHLDCRRIPGPSLHSPGAVPTPVASPQQISDPVLSTDTASVLGGAPSSPFSKWLQLGQPDKPQELQTQLQSTGPEAALSSILNLVAGTQEQTRPSLALGSASAAGRPESLKSAAVSTTNVADGSSTAEAGTEAPVTSECDLNIPAAAEEDRRRLDSVTLQGLALLHPCMDGRVKPQIASILGHSRVGRRLLFRLLRSEIGEVSNRRSWHDSQKMTSGILRLYEGPLRVQGWDAALVEASRVRKEATLAQMKEDYVAIAGVPKLLITGLHDRTAPPRHVKDMAEQMEGGVQNAVLAGCGHLSHEEAAEDLLYHLVDFVSANV